MTATTGRRIAFGTATYVVSGALQRAVPFLLLPLFTRILTTEEFGQIGIITAIAGAVTVVVSLGLESAVFRGYLNAAAVPEAARSFVASVGAFALVAAAISSIVFIVVLAPPLAEALDLPLDALRLGAVGASLTAIATVGPLAILRAQERLGDYVQLTGLQVLITPIATVLFVAAFDWAVTGWMLAYALGATVLLGRGLVMIRDDWAPSFEVGHLRSALAFALPLLPHAAGHWGLSVSDRAILGAYVPAADVGLYYTAFLVSLPVTLLAVSISQATQPMYVEASRSGSARSRLERVMTAHVLVVALTTASAMVLGPPVVAVLLPPEYAGAAGLAPWLALAAGFFGLYLVPMNVVTMVVGRTSRVWMITLTAAVVNIFLNLLFVPRIGTTAAAINTTIGYGLLVIGVFLYARHVCQPPIHYAVDRLAIGLTMIAVPLGIATLLVPGDSVIGLVIRALVILIATAALAAFGPLHELAALLLPGWRIRRTEGST